MTPWVSILLTANIAMFAVQQARPDLANALVFFPSLAFIADRPWTPITYMFLHGGFTHLLFNMLGLYFFGPRVEDKIGGGHFAALYLVSGLTGAALSFLSGAPIIGASGATFGVFFAFARYWPRETILLFGIAPVEARMLVIIMTVVSVVNGFRASDNIAHWAHLGGYVGAWLYLLAMDRKRTAAAREFKAKSAPAPVRVVSGMSDVERWTMINRDKLHALNRGEVERLLAKIRQYGVSSLTPEERATLDRFSA